MRHRFIHTGFTFILLVTFVSGFLHPLEAVNAVTVTWKKLRELDFNTGKMTPSLQGLNGRTVRVPGFMIPLEDGMGTTSEFLLAPFAMACIHVPAPPPNQIIHVTMKGGKKATVYWYEPVWVYGTLRVQQSETVFTPTSFTLQADRIALLTPEELGGNYFD